MTRARFLFNALLLAFGFLAKPPHKQRHGYGYDAYGSTAYG